MGQKTNLQNNSPLTFMINDKSIKLDEIKRLIKHEIGSLKNGQSPYKILDFVERSKSSLMKTTLMSGLLNAKYETHNTLSG